MMRLFRATVSAIFLLTVFLFFVAHCLRKRCGVRGRVRISPRLHRQNMLAQFSKTVVIRSPLCKFSKTTVTTGFVCGYFIRRPGYPTILSTRLRWPNRPKQFGYKFLLDFHYSDTWADPQKQFIPKAWEGMSHEQLVDAVFSYTRDSIAAFRDAGAMPDMVQIGNEVTGGMMWPDGKLPNNWSNFADLLKAGIRGR